MRSKLIIAAVLVQFLVLGWMAGEREWIIATRPTVWLRTAPVDPRDLFRGDYVTLGYEISTIPAEKFGPGLKKHMADFAKRNTDNKYWRGREIVLYAALKVNPESGVAEVATADLTPPATGLFIKGRVRPNEYRTDLTGVAYGIDAYFVQQGKGRELERRAPPGTPEGIQVPMEMQVALGRNGTAVLKDHRWNALGIETEVREKETTGSTKPVKSATGRKTGHKIIRVTLFNAGNAPLAVVLPSDLSTLRLQRMESWNVPGGNVSVPRTNQPPLTDADVRVLKPGEKATADIDPAKPEWFVQTKPDAPPRPLGSRDGEYHSFRIVYEAPTAEICQRLKEATRIVHTPLEGRQFSTYEFNPDENLAPEPVE